MAGRIGTTVGQINDPASGIKEVTQGVHTECIGVTVDTGDNSTTVYNGPAILLGVYVNTVLSAHTVVIQDNATAKVTLPASLAAGTNLAFPGVRCETSLVVNPDDSSTGNITVFYRPL
jgi:hypothetical protein